MIGEFTEKAAIYENLAKANNIKLDMDVKNLITDIITLEDQIIENTKASEKRDRMINSLRERNLFKEYIKEKYGSFYFSYYNKILDKLKPQYLTRALYLSSFMNYNNKLVEGTTRPRLIHEEDLQRLLRLSRTETFNTKRELLNIGFLIIGEDKTISVSEDYCKKGEVAKDKNISKARIFNEAITEMYENSVPNEHKKLALLFKMLPYINLRHNIVCTNIAEEIRECVIPLTIKSLAEILEQTNTTRFKKDLLSIKVKGKPAVAIISVLDKTAILINPSIYYKGTQKNDVKDVEERINEVVRAI